MTLSEKLAQASLDVGKLAADKRNKEQNYDYLSADLILSKAGEALAKVGVAIYPSVLLDEVNRFEYTDQYGKAKARYDARIQLQFTVTDGDMLEICNWYGAGEVIIPYLTRHYTKPLLPGISIS